MTTFITQDRQDAQRTPLTEQELIELVNGIIALATPMNSNDVDITDLDTPIADTGLDSLDMLMFSIYMSDLYGVDEETLKEMQPTTIRDVIEFMCQHKTKEPTNVEAALNDLSN